jgi:hypothetical protein
MSKMEGPMHYRPSGGPVNGTNPKLVHFPRISSETSPLKRETTIATSRNHHQSFLNIFSFLRSKRQERPILIRDSDIQERKAPLKPIIQRHSIHKMQSSVEASPYLWPHDGSLDPKTTALVIIDMQKDCEYRLKVISGHFSSPFQINLAPLDPTPLLFQFILTYFSLLHTRDTFPSLSLPLFLQS